MEYRQQSLEKIQFEPHAREVVGEDLQEVPLHHAAEDGIGRGIHLRLQQDVTRQVVHALAVGHLWMRPRIANQEPFQEDVRQLVDVEVQRSVDIQMDHLLHL